ncbi:MAG: hypothetical protein GXO58_08710 [Thermodesulfobacteria bacterium]|nr:hypothetical protein [Thermodesulfobacteriota bacterium]
MTQGGAKGAQGQNSRAKDFSLSRFLITYLVLMGVVFLALSLKPLKQVLDLNGLYTQAIVKATALLLRPFGLVRGVDGSIIHLSGISLDIKFGCNGLEAFLIYLVGIVSFPARWRAKAWGLILGFLIIQVLNVLRIVALGYFGVHMANYFYIFHIYVAQGIMIAVAFLIFIVWLHHVVNA